MNDLLAVIKNDEDFIETQNILNYMLFVETNPPHCESYDVISHVFNYVYTNCEKYIFSNFWGGDYRIKNLLTDVQMKQSLKYHLLISSLYTAKQLSFGRHNVSSYCICNKIQGDGLFSLLSNSIYDEQFSDEHIKPKYFSSKTDIKEKTDSIEKQYNNYEVSAFNLKFKRILDFDNYTSKILNTMIDSTNYDFCKTDFIYQINNNYNLPRRRKESSQTMITDLTNSFPKLSQADFYKKDYQVIDKLLLDYQGRRYYPIDLFTHIKRCRHFLFSSKNALVDMGALGNFDKIMSLAADLPNVYSRKVFVNFALSGLLSSTLRDSPFTGTFPEGRNNIIASLLPRPYLAIEHEQTWIGLMEKYFVELTNITFPVFEKAFYISLYNYCKNNKLKVEKKVTKNLPESVNSTVLELLLSHIIEMPFKKSLFVNEYIMDECNPTLEHIQEATELPDIIPYANIENPTRSLYLHCIYNDIYNYDGSFDFGIDQIEKNCHKEFDKIYYSKMFNAPLTERFQKNFTIDYFTKSLNKNDYDLFKKDITFKYISNVISTNGIR
ncbi:MAG: hypothetical protein PHT84_07225 [Candidatus Pacebacteria bacterium]|nr:hypothetical protein [Candidatus Paceibacterota bacterium]